MNASRRRPSVLLLLLGAPLLVAPALSAQRLPGQDDDDPIPFAPGQAGPEAPPAETGPPELEWEALALPEVLVDRDDFVLDRSARVRFAEGVLADAAGDGVLVIRGDDLVVDLAGSELRGAAAGVLPNAYSGVGIRIEGARARVRGAKVSGYKVGIDARGTDALVLEDADVSDNFRQRLRSTPMAEDPADWLSPHRNDGGEWIRDYGAGIHVKEARDVTVRRCRAHNGQNGLVLDRVVESKIFDNDFSFLSGWGIALWRSSKNVLTRNQLDFCIRGYSAGVYNRGQDSAGMLFFEQCNENVVAENSMNHCGDGFFGFAGLEALGDVPAPEGFDYDHKGNNDNLFISNDMSYAAAHGYEMTFSFNNRVFGNRMAANGICGVWAGYSQGSAFVRNTIRKNGALGGDQERGGINIEHGKRNLIQYNRFSGNACGIALWWDPDPHLADKPWVKANGFDCGETAVFANGFLQDTVAIEVRDCPGVVHQQNEFTDCGDDMLATAGAEPKLEMVVLNPPVPPSYSSFGESTAVGTRRQFQGRQYIVMTEWGPHDWTAPLLWRAPNRDGAHAWKVLGLEPAAAEGEAPRLAVRTSGAVTTEEVRGNLGPIILVRPQGSGPFRYTLEVDADGTTLRGEADEIALTFEARAFAWTVDPREDTPAWRQQAEAGVPLTLSALALPLGGGGFADLRSLKGVAGLDALGADRLGLLAESSLELPAGTYTLSTRSDDGLRVWVDDELQIDDWTHHAATVHDAELVFPEDGAHSVRVEWFELDGGAELVVDLRPKRD